LDVDAMMGFEPNAVMVDDTNDSNRHGELSGCQRRGPVERAVRGRIENVEATNGVHSALFERFSAGSLKTR
jgi:hypothetical protein